MINLKLLLTTLSMFLIYTLSISANPALINTIKYESNNPNFIEYIWQAQYSPDGNKIITSGRRNIAYIWDSNSGQLIHALEGHKDYVQCAAFSPDGKLAITGSWDQTTKIWDVDTGELIKSLGEYGIGGGGIIYSVGISPDNNLVAVYQENIGIIIRNLNDGFIIKQIYTSAKTNIEFSPDQNYLLLKNLSNSSSIIKIDDGSYNEIPLAEIELYNTNKLFTLEYDINNPKRFLINKRKFPSMEIISRLGDIFVEDSEKYVVDRIISPILDVLILNKKPNTDNMGEKQNIELIQIITKEKICSYTPSFTQKGDYPYMRAIQFSPDGKRFLGIQGDTVYIYDISNLTSLIHNASTHK